MTKSRESLLGSSLSLYAPPCLQNLGCEPPFLSILIAHLFELSPGKIGFRAGSYIPISLLLHVSARPPPHPPPPPSKHTLEPIQGPALPGRPPSPMALPYPRPELEALHLLFSADQTAKLGLKPALWDPSAVSPSTISGGFQKKGGGTPEDAPSCL